MEKDCDGALDTHAPDRRGKVGYSLFGFSIDNVLSLGY